jgi:hypothetical protein
LQLISETLFKEGLLFVLTFPAPLEKYSTVYYMRYLATLVSYFVLRVEDITSSTTKTIHYSPIFGDSSSVDECVQNVLENGVPRDKIILAEPAYSIEYTLNAAVPTNGLGSRTNGSSGQRHKYTEVFVYL